MEQEYEIKILFDGYSKSTSNDKEMAANCTCTLIKGRKIIIVDTMDAWSGEKLKNALKNQNIQPEQVDYVVCTHGHSDHIGCNYLFQNATHIVGHCISKRDIYFDHNFFNDEYVLDKNVKVIATPGHTMQDVTVLVENSKGVYAITGDLFEKEEDLEDENIWKNAGSDSKDLQLINRKSILLIADFIIPGHGPMFINKEKKLKLKS